MSSTRKPPTRKGPGRRTDRKVELLVTAREARENAEQDLGFGLRPLVMCGLPLRSSKEILYIRRCGEFTLEILGDPRYGLPFGHDRIIPIWVATAFVHLGCPEDNTISFPYARDILRAFDLPVDGRAYQRLREGFLRFTHASFTVKRLLKSPKGAVKLHIKHLPLLDEVALWYEDNPESQEQRDWPNQITLDSRWADEIRRHPIPIDIQTVRALLEAPGALDFYQWQAWRTFVLKKQTRVPLEGDAGLIAQLGCLQDQPTFEIRRTLRRWQRIIRIAWPECKNHLSRDGRFFVLYPARAIPPRHKNSFLLRGLPRTPR